MVDPHGYDPCPSVCRTDVLPLSLGAQDGAESWFRANIFRSSNGRVNHHHYLGELARAGGIEPPLKRWQRLGLPLTYARIGASPR